MLKSDGLYLIIILFVILGCYTFFHGMFLTNAAIPDSSGANPLDGSSQWFQRKSKVIYLVLDGLRFDYYFKDPEVPEAEAFKHERSRLFRELFAKHPENLIMCKAFADTPTLTVQRIPSVITGSLPPKANVIMAFGALPIKEDSILRQARLAGRKPYFTGEVLWNDFFPDDLITTTETRSFDIKDDDVDYASVEFLHYIIQNEEYNFLIAHLFGLDHMGHAHGVGDARMSDAIFAMDKILGDIIDMMDDDTTLMLVGDHGMDYAGEHGHDSKGETNTAIIAYNKKGFQKYQEKDLAPIMKSFNDTTNIIHQEDIVPTISMLLGLPIPFSNLGQIITDAYPVGSIPKFEACPESSFEVQALRDNYINSLQLWNYFSENQRRTHLFKQEDLKHLKNLFNELEADYNNAQEVIKNPAKCSQIHQKAIDTIQKAQFFAKEIRRVTRNTGSYDILMALLGIFSLILVAICYILLTQYVFVEGQHEQKLIFNLKNFCFSLKSLIPLAIAVLIVSTTTWYLGKKRQIYGFVGGFLTAVFWYIGSLSIFLLTRKEDQESSPSTAGKKLHISNSELDAQVISVKVKSDDDSESNKEDFGGDDPEDLPTSENNSKRANKYQDQAPLFNAGNENAPFLASPTLFVFQHFRYTIGLVVIFLFSIYLIHIRNFLVLNLRYEKPASPYIALLLIGYRLGTIFRGKMIFTMLASVLLCAYLKFQHFNLLTFNIMIPLGLLVAGDYVYGEVHYIVKGLNTHKAWGWAYYAAFAVMAIFNLQRSKETYLEEIVLPRIVWAILIGILIARKVIKVEPEVWKRNAQLCLVIFLFLVRREREILALSIVLTIMKTTTNLFKQADKKNFLFPVVMAFEAYVGLFHLEFTDFNVPFNFSVAFIGLDRFNAIFSPLFFLMSYLSTLIIALVHVSQYNQYLDSQTGHGSRLQLTDSENFDDEKPSYLPTSHVKIMKKRNILLYMPYFNLVMISAAIRLLVLREEHFDLVFEKTMVDGLFYMFTLVVGYFML